MGASWADRKSKKSALWSVIFSYSMQQQTISWLNCDVWWKVCFIWKTAMTNSVAGPRRSSKALPKAKLAPTKGPWSLFGGLLQLSESCKTITSEKWAQQINEMHQKLQHLQPALVNRVGPILLDTAPLHVVQPILQKLNKLGYEVLPHLLYAPHLRPTDYYFFKHLNNFLQWKCFHNQ